MYDTGEMHTLAGKVGVVTGGTYGVGRGVASVLAQSGARAFVTGRSADPSTTKPDGIVRIRCDHRQDADVEARSPADARRKPNRHPGQ